MIDDNKNLKPLPLAVALYYDDKDTKTAPRVTAKGSGDIATQIIDIARRYNVPLQDNPELVKILSHIELGEQIPEALYLAVAQIIAFAYMLKGKVPGQNNVTE